MTAFSKWFTGLVDFFYFPVFRKFLPLQTFRYAACGALNMVFGWALYYLVFHYIFMKQDLHLGLLTVSSHIATLGIVFTITTVTGFILNKYISFKNSILRDRTQMIRYSLSVVGSLSINYLLLKLFVDALGFYPTPSQMVSGLIIAVYSYLMQKYFSFRGCDDE